jgi:hypothetical protein
MDGRNQPDFECSRDGLRRQSLSLPGGMVKIGCLYFTMLQDTRFGQGQAIGFEQRLKVGGCSLVHANVNDSFHQNIRICLIIN